MSDVVLDSQFNWSPIRTGFEDMRLFASQSTAAVGHDISRMFAGFAVGAAVFAGIESGLHSIVEEAHEIHAVSEKFRLDAESLQTIGNVARDMGISLDQVGRAMNRLELNAYKATQADNEQRKALEGLGIEANQFFRLSADEKILRLAEAYENAGDKATAYAQIASLVGRRESEVIRIIERGSEAIREQGNQAKYSADQLERIEEARVIWVRLGHELKLVGAELFTGLFTPIIRGIDGINKAFDDMAAGIKQAFSGDVWEGVKRFLIGSPVTPSAPHAPGPATPAERANVEGEGGAGAGSGQSAKAEEDHAKNMIALTEKLAKLERDRAFEQLNDLSKLAVLERELTALRLQASDYSQGDEKAAEARVAEAEKLNEVEKLRGKISQDQVNYDAEQARLRDKMAAQADQDLADAQESVLEMKLQLAGRKDLAERAKIEYDYNQRIHAAQNAITEAEKQGFTEVVATNKALVDQLQVEKNVALAAHDKATAEEMAKKAAEEKAKVDDEKQNLADLQAELVIMDLKLAGQQQAARWLEIELSFNKQINQALGQAADLWTQMAAAYRDGNIELGNQLARHAELKDQEAAELELEKQKTQQLELQTSELKSQGQERSRQETEAERTARAQGPSPLTVGFLAENNLRLGATSDVYAAALAASRGLQPGSPEYERLVQQITAEDQLRNLQGKNLPFADQAARDKLVQWYAKMQQQDATKNAATSHQQEIDYWQNIAAGHPERNTGNPYTGLFSTSQNVIPGQDNAVQIAKLSTQIDIQQKQLDTLQQIQKQTEIVRI